MNDPTSVRSRDIFSKCLAQSIKADVLDADMFKRRWFRRGGGELFVLYRKNLSVTDIQFAELRSLLLTHARVREDAEKTIRLVAIDEFSVLLNVVYEGLKEASVDLELDSFVERFAVLYADLFSSTMAIKDFWGSSVVYVPPAVEVDVESLCAESGYIHSVGRLIFEDLMDQTRRDEFLKALDTYLSDKSTVRLFTPYSVEDFTKFEDIAKHVKDMLKSGLDDVKIRVEKLSMGQFRLANVIDEVAKRFAGKLRVPKAGNYREYHGERNNNTIWLLADYEIEPTQEPSSTGNVSVKHQKSDRRHYICYDQTLANRNVFHIYDENKPGWIAHTTIPHTLLAAMLNVTRPWSEDYPVVGDPFGGSGTTLFEAYKFKNVRIQISDINPISRTVTEDNWHFFSLGEAALRKLKVRYEELCARMTEVLGGGERTQPSLLGVDGVSMFEEDVFLQELPNLVHTINSSSIGESRVSGEGFLRRFRSLRLEERLVAYTLLRAELRHEGGRLRRSTDRRKAFEAEYERLSDEMESHLELVRLIGGGRWDMNKARYVVEDKYSPAVIPSYNFICSNASLEITRALIVKRDARDLGDRQLDVVITDPPYGFNTDDDLLSLAHLYKDFWAAAIRAVKNGGHLVVALPSVTYVGRPLPFCTNGALVFSQIVQAAVEQGRVARVPRVGRAGSAVRFGPPYYWEADQALRREILHFVVQDA